MVQGQQRACMPVYIGKSGDLVGCYRSLTHSQTTEYSATQLVCSIKFKLSHAMRQDYQHHQGRIFRFETEWIDLSGLKQQMWFVSFFSFPVCPIKVCSKAKGNQIVFKRDIFQDIYIHRLFSKVSVIFEKIEPKLDPVGSNVRYEMMKLCTGSLVQYRTLWGGSSW